MSNLHRIAWIDAQIRAQRYPNARSVAEEFEISRRQAARDLEFMRYSLNAPLEYSAARNGYDYTDPSFRLPLAGASLPESVRRAVPSGVQPNASETRARLRRAIDDRRIVALRARNPGQALTISRVHPYRIALERGGLDPYLVAYCETRTAVHAFHLAFIESVEVLGRHFREQRPEPPEILLLRRPYRAQVEMPAHALPHSLAPAAHWPQPGLCEIEFYSSDALLGALFGQPVAFHIRGPRWLRRRLRERLGALAAQHVGPEREDGGRGEVGHSVSHPVLDTPPSVDEPAEGEL